MSNYYDSSEEEEDELYEKYENGEECAMCDEPASPYHCLQDGYYCEDCYESQK